MTSQQLAQTLASHPISRRWPASDPDVLQLYSFPTPNGVKVSIALEEMGIAYEPHLVKISGDQHTPEFLSLNPNNKIPAILDPTSPDGKLIALWESGAILIYLAEKSEMFLPTDATTRAATYQWLMFQMGGLGPMIGQYGYFARFAGKEIEDPRPKQRYVDEARRLLGVLDRQLAHNEFVTGSSYTIADIAIYPWLWAARDNYKAGDDMDLDSFEHTMSYLERCLLRPGVEKALNIPARE